MRRFKVFFAVLNVFLTAALTGCSTNPATGQQQFTALMSPQQEVQVGASEHQKIAQQFGFYEDARVNAYVTSVGRKVTTKTERPDVQYKFFVLDSPIVNAFALPGGYIYVSRGLLALANSEAELAAVLAHETGHITGRHSAERYSRGVVTTLGAGVLSAVLGSDGASQALGVGANLYLSAYSRGQESEADALGLRYMTHGGYDVDAMAKFLSSLKAQSDLDSRLAGNGNANGFSYFSTHPATADRVAQTRTQARNYPSGGQVNRNAHLNIINGMIYGDSAAQGFVRGQSFYHPKMDFTFTVPAGFNLKNSPAQITASASNGAVLIFDMAANKQGLDPRSYVQSWVDDRQLQGLESINVHGRTGATASFAGNINGRPVTIRLVAIAYGDRFARFQMAIPAGAPAAQLEGLKAATYSFRSMSDKEKNSVHPYRLQTFIAQSGDSVASIVRRQPFTNLQEERFLVLNGLRAGEPLQTGWMYKKIVE
ncbi:MAG: M48 family metalloprotease [Rhodospirillales bacterium]|nr:M48 family metalloprotease [Alphaproteobacteria bacterium]USO06410.1 MAG: M48 family metalloprotease [Rhodospirillales bacterium]